MGQHGMVRAISPVNTMGDGDLVIALSLGNEQADLNAMGNRGRGSSGRVDLRARKECESLGGLPGLKD